MPPERAFRRACLSQTRMPDRVAESTPVGKRAYRTCSAAARRREKQDKRPPQRRERKGGVFCRVRSHSLVGLAILKRLKTKTNIAPSRQSSSASIAGFQPSKLNRPPKNKRN